MSGFFDRFRRSRGARAGLVCYLRENGPIAYALDIFGREPRDRAGVLAATDQAWYWRTMPRDDRAARDWTHVTAWSLAALLGDIAAEPHGVVAPLVLIGLDGRDARPDVTDTLAVSWMNGFDAGAERPVHAVVTRPAPGGDLLFVAQQPPEGVRALLQAWGIDRDKAVRRAYARLQSHSLAQLTRVLVSERK